MRKEKALRPPLAPVSFKTAREAGLLSALVALPAIVAATAGSAALASTVIYLLIMIVAVVALSTFSGNSGILSFGHVAFMALGAQISSTLTLDPSLKARLLPDLGHFLQSLQLGFWTAAAIAVAIVMVVALVVGIGLMRLPAVAASLSTLGVLIIVNSILTASAGITRGNQAMHSVPQYTTIWVAAISAAVTLFIAYLYKHSSRGLELRASREDEAAARSVFRAKHILTNPPYGRGLADAFVTHALALTKRTGGTVAMLLAIQSLAHPRSPDPGTASGPATRQQSSTPWTTASAGPTAIPPKPPPPSANNATAGSCGSRVLWGRRSSSG